MKPELEKYSYNSLQGLIDSGKVQGWNEAIDAIHARIAELEAAENYAAAETVRELLHTMGRREKNETAN